jgi:hypothetical protein
MFLGFNQHDSIYSAYQFFYQSLLQVGGLLWAACGAVELEV